MATERTYPCPCCGYMTFDEPTGSFSICGVCGWEDDHVQLAFPQVGGANQPLIVCQRAFLIALNADRQAELAARGLIRCPDWRPLEAADIDRATHPPTSGRAYFEAAGGEAPEYYWRRGSPGPSP